VRQRHVTRVTSLGVERRPIFVDDHNREMFLQFLGRVVIRFGWSLTAYVLHAPVSDELGPETLRNVIRRRRSAPVSLRIATVPGARGNTAIRNVSGRPLTCECGRTQCVGSTSHVRRRPYAMRRVHVSRAKATVRSVSGRRLT
jgi:hypothetical protein